MPSPVLFPLFSVVELTEDVVIEDLGVSVHVKAGVEGIVTEAKQSAPTYGVEFAEGQVRLDLLPHQLTRGR